MKKITQKELTLFDLVVIRDIESVTPKLFYETVKLKPAIVADKHIPYAASNEKHSLGEYPQKLLDRWKNNKNIIIYENDEQLRRFVRQSRTKYRRSYDLKVQTLYSGKKLAPGTVVDAEGNPYRNVQNEQWYGASY